MRKYKSSIIKRNEQTWLSLDCTVWRVLFYMDTDKMVYRNNAFYFFMIGGWLLSRNPLEKVMFGNLNDGFQTEEKYFSAMTAAIILGLNHNYLKTDTFHIVVEDACLLLQFLFVFYDF